MKAQSKTGDDAMTSDQPAKRFEPQSDPERASRIRKVLLSLELVSHGPTQAWNKSGSPGGEPDDRMVALVLKRDEPPHLAYRARYEAAFSISARNTIIMEAEDELESSRRRVAELPEGEDRSMVLAIVEDGEGWEPRAVAQRFNVPEAMVRRVRSKNGRATEDGRPLSLTLAAVDRAEKARELRDRGLSLRQIAMYLKCGVGTVSRDLAA